MVPGGADQSSATSGPSISRASSAMPSVIPSGAERNFCVGFGARGSGLGARGSGEGEGEGEGFLRGRASLGLGLP